MPPRFYCPTFSDREATLDGDELHHLRAVRRLAAGDEVELFDGAGRLARCRIASLDKRRAELEVLDVTASPPPALQLTVAAAVPKAARADWMIEKLAELGVAALWPLVTDRSDVAPRGARCDKWRRRAIEAAKQCGRLHLMEIAAAAPLDEALARCAERPPDVMIVADPSPEAARLADVLGEARWQTTTAAVAPDSERAGCHGQAPATERSDAAGNDRVAAGHGQSAHTAEPACPWRPSSAGEASVRRIIAFVGPEGGFTDAERTRLRAAGAQPVRLGPHILRIETAAEALAAAVMAII